MAEDQSNEERQLVVFDLAEQTYGVEISSVREIIRFQKITSVPDAPQSVEGIINLRGSVIPVADLRKRLGLAVTDATAQSRIVVMEIGGADVGVVVDAVADVLRVPVDSIEAVSSIATTAESFYVSGIAKIEDQLLLLLDLDQALSSEALEHFAQHRDEMAAGGPEIAVVPADAA